MNRQRLSYQEAIQYLYSLQRFGIKFGLSKTANLLSAAGNPHEGQHYVHLAGTNGKGSVGAFLASILKQAGLKVGFYTSPHLVRFTERFKINDKEISQQMAAGLVEELKAAVDPRQPPTFFEATTAMALTYFAREKTDIAIMETGMGGRLDATNVITPLVCVITNIAMEHQFFLGSRLMDIAGEKAGIIKEGVDLVTGASQPEVVKFFQSVCDEKKAPMFRLGKDFRSRTTATGFHYSGRALRLKKLNLGLRGRFQARNAALALAVIESLKEKGFEVSSRDIRKGLKKVCWPGRMHLLGTEPTLILDGAHNPAAIRTLADCIKKEFVYRRLILVIGIMEDKEIGRIVRNIVPISDYTLYTRPLYPRAADPRLLMDAGAALGKAGEAVIPLPRALDRSREMAGPEDLILVTGSLFTVGEAMAYLDPETYGPDET